MYNEINNLEETGLGKIQIAPQVIEIIAKQSTIDVNGVASLNGRFEFTDLFGKNKTAAKGVRVELTDSEVIVNISIIIKNGYRIPELADNIQESVKNSVETMTDLNVTEVNVYIDGIVFENDQE